MTTATETSAAAHSTDADFRAWGSAFSTLLSTAGLVKAADTGQINWTTVTIPGTSTYGGYEIWYLNDSLHGTKPCYFKIEYGTAASSGRPSMRISAASATNGAGTLSGTTYLSATVLSSNTAMSGGTHWSGVCVREGYFAFIFRRTAFGSSAFPVFACCRTCDDSGTPTSAGFVFYCSGTSTYLSRTTYISSAIADGQAYTLFPGAAASTLASGSPQVMRHFMFQPAVRCVPQLLGSYYGEIGDLSTFTATPIGATQRTYLNLAHATHAPSACSPTGTSEHRVAMQWE